MNRNNILTKYAKKEVNPAYYGKIKIDDTPIKYITHEQFKNGESGYILAPFIIRYTPYVLVNGKKVWQINRWKRFKLWIKSVFK